MSSTFVRKLVAGALLAFALGACQSIAGIEDRVLDPEAGAGGKGDSALCKTYCATVMANCTGKNAVYSTEPMCLGVCKLLEPGDVLEPVGNTVVCRENQAELAELEPAEHCKAAGPGGGGVCGSDCDAYCDLFPKACPSDDKYKSKAGCLKACRGLTDLDRYDLVKDHEGDTIECRLVHVSSATINPKDHCSHAPIPPTEPWCTGKADEEPSCDEYCNIQLASCDDELLQYESPEQCRDVCEALDRGVNSDQLDNTVACRRYHSFTSTLPAGESHCYHSGPTGDGHCGDIVTGNCDSYCQLVASACPDELAESIGDTKACLAQCAELPEHERDSLYTIDSAKESTGLHCRVLHATRAFADKSACAAAVGGDPCE